MTESIEIDGVNLHYTVQGSGAPLILMHGWGCNHSTVASIAQTAAQTHTVYNVDFPGFGDSPEPPEVWGVEQYTRLIERFAEHLGLQRPVLAGHSFGGRVGILFASRNDVDKLILIDAAGVKPRRSLKYYFKVYKFKLAKWFVHRIYSRDKAEAKIETWRRKRGSADYADSSPRMRAILSRVVNEDLRHVMPSIKAPTLLIWGENDTATPMRDASIMERLIPDAGLVSFPGCGHYSFLDNPRQFAAVLNSFLNS
ncbi:MAG: alpha/beta hydrolase [Bacteroides sp.]|nr:alpha/beta hydrolase [Bacteroides sp.]MCM1413429.1 alpha/beta hydrolase [Bacteroides sp.]MCM1471360.1 alpha/beta hydrolase [Bacteroides sp.]